MDGFDLRQTFNSFCCHFFVPARPATAFFGSCLTGAVGVAAIAERHDPQRFLLELQHPILGWYVAKTSLTPDAAEASFSKSGLRWPGKS